MSGWIVTGILAVGLALGLAVMVSTRREVRRLRELVQRDRESRWVPQAPAGSEPSPPPEPPGRPRPSTVVPYVITGDAKDVVVPTVDQIRQAALADPIARAAALTHGLRRAMEPANRDKVASLMRREFSRRRKMRMRAGRRAARMADMAPVDRPRVDPAGVQAPGGHETRGGRAP